MDKYYLFKHNIYEYVKKCDERYAEFKILKSTAQFVIRVYKRGEIVQLRVSTLKDITETYNKLTQLSLTILDVKGYNQDAQYVTIIIREFLEGSYPTRAAFKYLNVLWKKYK